MALVDHLKGTRGFRQAGRILEYQETHNCMVDDATFWRAYLPSNPTIDTTTTARILRLPEDGGFVRKLARIGFLKHSRSDGGLFQYKLRDVLELEPYIDLAVYHTEGRWDKRMGKRP